MEIIETKEQWDKFFIDFNQNETLVIPVFTDLHRHPVENSLCLLYIKFLVSENVVILPLNHSDAKNIPFEWVETLSPTSFKCKCVTKKALTHKLPAFKHSDDVLYYLRSIRGSLPDERKFYTTTQRYFYNKFYKEPNINIIVPLMKLIEFCDVYVEDILKDVKKWEDRSDVVFHEDKVLPVCQFIEASGIHVDSQKFGEYFGQPALNHVFNNLFYSEYNPYTTTHRISNRFASINMSALDKSTGCRESLTSRFERGAMVLIDFESFHLRLIADLIGYNAPVEPFHEHLAKQYFHTETPTSEEYNEGKRRSFSYLYGTGPDPEIDFFQKVNAFKEILYESFLIDKKIVTDVGGTILLNHVEEPNVGKIFNYLLQLREMEVSILAIADIIPLFQTKKSKIVLYTYDSILIDYNFLDGKEFLQKIVTILEQDHKYPVRIFAGPHYNELKNITNLVKFGKLKVST